VGAPGQQAEDQVGVANPLTSSSSSSSSTAKNTQVASNTSSLKPGKKEKIRYGQSPTKTLPSTAPTQSVDAGANGTAAVSPDAAGGTQVAANAAGDAPGFNNTPAAPEKKTRYSDRASIPKEKKTKVPKVDPFAPPPVSAQEVADRQTQSAPLGLAGDTSKTAKPKPTEKTRLQDQLKNKPAADANAGTPLDTTSSPPPTANPPAPTAPPVQPQ
jgi:peptidyl-prolyl cis-trans isomerase SurA